MESIELATQDEDFLKQEVFLKFLSKKYTILILKELHMNEKKRFGNLVKNLGNVSTKTMSNRLKELVEYGLVSRAATPLIC